VKNRTEFYLLRSSCKSPK